MTPEQPLTVILAASQWNAVMALLAEAPYRISAPLIQAIQQQCMAADAGASGRAQVSTNGMGEEVRGDA